MKSLNSQILRLAIPSIMANITIPLVGIVDTAIVGHIANATYIGGIAIGTMLFDLLYWNFGFLRVGTSGMTAQAYGRGDGVECARLLTQSVSIALIGAVVLWLIQWLFVTAVLAIVPCSTEVAAFAREYFFIRIWAAPATLSLMAFKGWFIGMQDTVSPMITDIVVNVVNMTVSYVLAVYTPLGALGVAYGTLVAQFTGLLLALIICLFKYKTVVQDLVRLLCDKAIRLFGDKEMKRFMSLNGNLFVRSLCFMVVYVGFTSLASQYGDVELAVSTIMMKLFMLFSYFVDGFAYAGEALVGKDYGASRSLASSSHRLVRIVRLLFAWSLGVGLLFTLLFAVWSEECYLAMTNDMEVLVVSGIAQPKPMLSYLSQHVASVNAISFADHHHFSQKDWKKIQKCFDEMSGSNKCIVVTEKDAVKLRAQKIIPESLKDKVWVLPIKVSFLQNAENP